MPVVKVSFTDEAYQKLATQANAKGCSVQDLIRNKLFGDEVVTFTPEDAVQRVFATYEVGETFTIPSLYGDAWASMRNGIAGVFGKRFNRYVEENCPEKIMYVDKTENGRHALYKLVSK